MSCCLFGYFHIGVMSFSLVCGVLPSGVAISDPSFSLNPCFCHAKLTATLWVNAACECWDGRGVSEWKAPIRATCMVLHNWLHSVFFKEPSCFLSLSLSLIVSWVRPAVARHTGPLGPPSSRIHTHQTETWLFIPDDIVNTGKVGWLGIGLFHPGCC